MTKLNAERVGEALVLGQLAAVIGLDPIARQRQRIERGAIAGAGCGIELGRRHAQSGRLDVDTIEFPRELDQRGIAARGDIRNDRADRLLDVRRGLALGVEKNTKPRGEIRGAGVKTDRHGRGLSPFPSQGKMAHA